MVSPVPMMPILILLRLEPSAVPHGPNKAIPAFGSTAFPPRPSSIIGSGINKVLNVDACFSIAFAIWVYLSTRLVLILIAPPQSLSPKRMLAQPYLGHLR